ncbi:putative radical SAM enzyme (TIGR03279 family) [Alkaliphilus hydrothermalis]|uniref:Radical SAM enzyme (TIGR03279 family) n=1 Tax=Alkaliphilus hydrothermalis TaxID=1482730 RepID=A0ABS2NNP4_9FIRM|nr:DUF512 domain-containing protein [Alkaliphilus hydrothermalis]MBM7614566.1 putative radical SAM enzyme (TIGR03279 family) [Alkaliphilus hydrothermalis]
MKEVEIKNIISAVETDSIAEEVGIEVGDKLISINGQPIEDIIEYKFYLADEYLEIVIEKPDGEEWLIEVDKEYDEDLGIDFDNPILSHMKSCSNKCIFCFIDQLPMNMRESLYFKDDDSRLSFLHGNYITLTNMKEEDIKKIIQYRISPINISVHTTNGELRKKMLNNRFAGNIMETLERLAENHISMNCQIVLCPGFNDGEELDKTLEDLGKLSDAVDSVAVVPVGLTRYREELVEINPFTKETANETIQQIEKWQQYFKPKIHRNFVYASDEFYITAQKEFPDYEEYDGFPQLENGVGMMVDFAESFHGAVADLSDDLKIDQTVTVVTSTLAEDYMNELGKALMEKVEGLKVNVICVKNDFFGGHVSVSGLLTGGDILKSIQGKDLGVKIIVGENMLKSGEPVFLDDVTIDELQEKTGVPVKISPIDGREFVETILDGI